VADEDIGFSVAALQDIIAETGKVIVGQSQLVERLLVALLANGHILIEGVPGLAKTTAVRVLSETIEARFQRVQFTPDLLPADIIGTLIYDPRSGGFSTRKGPVFANILLADEINRAPAKVQSALLEAMEERQVTIGEQTFPLDDPFLVMATQNPIEQEGTYPLPEAQLDRFMLKIHVTYPSMEEERLILRRMGHPTRTTAVRHVIGPDEIRRLRTLVDSVYMDPKIEEYVLNLVFSTRFPERHGLSDIKGMIRYGASPRATIYLTIAGKAYALIQGRTYVVPQDIKSIGPDVLRHRVLLSYEAEAEDMTPDDVLKRIFDTIEVP
jgi:MoxR-like ATPase